MKLLWIAPSIPYPPTFGGSIRIYHLLKSAALTHEVHLVCLDRIGKVTTELNKICKRVHTFKMDKGYRRAMKYSLLNGKSHIRTLYRNFSLNIWMKVNARAYDAIVVESTQMAWTTMPDEVPKILDMHNLEYEVPHRLSFNEQNPLRRWYRRQDARKLKKEEMNVLREFDLIATTSKREMDILEAYSVRAEIVKKYLMELILVALTLKTG